MSEDKPDPSEKSTAIAMQYLHEEFDVTDRDGMQVRKLAELLDSLNVEVPNPGDAAERSKAGVDEAVAQARREALQQPSVRIRVKDIAAIVEGLKTPRVRLLMSTDDLTGGAELIREAIDWSKLPKLREMFEHRPPVNRLWHELVMLVLGDAMKAMPFGRPTESMPLTGMKPTTALDILKAVRAKDEAIESWRAEAAWFDHKKHGDMPILYACMNQGMTAAAALDVLTQVLRETQAAYRRYIEVNGVPAVVPFEAMNGAAQFPWLTSLVEILAPLKPGARFAKSTGVDDLIYEVRKLRTMSTPIAGKSRPIYAIVHGGERSVVLVVCLVESEPQTEWRLFMPLDDGLVWVTEDKISREDGSVTREIRLLGKLGEEWGR